MRELRYLKLKFQFETSLKRCFYALLSAGEDARSCRMEPELRRRVGFNTEP